MSEQRTVVFFPEGAFGPTNNCVGIGEVLRERGHRVVFIAEESFAGTLEARGFEERLMRLGPPADVAEEPGQFWKDFIRDTAPSFRRPTIEQLEAFMLPTWTALCEGARYVEPRLREILDELEPDVVVQDNVVGFPALPACGRPWVRIVSCNPLELKDPALPPPYSGLPLEDSSEWEAFRAEYRRTHGDLQRAHDEFCRASGAPPLGDMEFVHASDYLNLYLYPRELDYPRPRPPTGRWERLESCVRGGEPPYELPAELAAGGRTRVYLSLGSLGSADTELMQRLVDVLASADLAVVVSMGPQHEALRLRGDMVGAEFLPQPSILPQMDVAITHGGNNTTTECMHFGVPMIVLPQFWDQYDNAQRVRETGYGVRLQTYAFADEELLGAIDRLAGDAPLRARMAETARRLQADPGTVRAADLVEGVAGG